MNILRLSTLSLILGIAVITLGTSADGWAAPGPCSGPKDGRDPECGAGDQPVNDTSDCQIDFSVKFSEGPAYVVESDGLSDETYQYPDLGVDSRDKSWAGAGPGAGFRFDTNGKQLVDTARDKRWLQIEPVLVPIYGSMHMSGADFRFHLPFGGLDLCSLDAKDLGTVPMILLFADDGGQEWKLLYDCIFHDTSPIIDPDPDKGAGSRNQVTVTRNKGTAGGWTAGDTWTITGSNACLILATDYATATPVLEHADLSADFEMTIEAQ